MCGLKETPKKVPHHNKRGRKSCTITNAETQPREYRHFISSPARLYKRLAFPFHFRIIIHSSYTRTASILFFLVGRYFRMVRFSNNVIGLLNFATFVLSVPILGGGIWLAAKADTDCEKFLQWPVIAIGAFLMLVSLAGLVGACCRITWLMWFYLAVMFILILLLFCFTVFAFVVTNKGAGQSVSGKGYKEYRLGDYSNWLQKRVEKSSNWNKIKSCLQDAKVCKSLADNSVNEVAEQFYKRNLSPIQSGCCKPPSSCNFSYVNATYWTSTSTGSNSTDVDCSRWSNDEDQLCYSCNSCKAGVLANLKHDWRKIAIINIVVLIALVVVYSVGCCAFRNNRRDERNGHGYKGYP